MAGGTWFDQNKVRPGVYINYKSAPASLAQMGDRGVVAIGLDLNWGPVGRIIELNDPSECWALLGYDQTAPEMLFVRQIFLGSNRTAGASKILVWRLAKTSAAAATATTGNLTATAKYAGTRGNSISIVVSEDPDNPTSPATGLYKCVVQTLVDGGVVDVQEVSKADSMPTVSQLSANDWVDFSGTGALSAGTVSLSGGTNGSASATAYSDFLGSLETRKFDVLVYDGSDATTISTVKGYVKRLSDDEGRRCQCVVSNSLGDSECVISTYDQSVTLASGETLSAGQFTWWVAGCTAGAKVNESLTYAAHPDAVSISPAPTSAQQETALNAGYFTLFDNAGTIQVLQDINSFISYAVEKGKAFRKNRVVRVVFGIANDIYDVFAKYYIGTTNNNEEGRKLMKAEILNLLNRYQANSALQNVLVDDVEVLPGADSDAVVVNIAIQPVDSVEKIYVTVTIS